MSDSPLRKKKVFVTCPTCKGYKGIYGHSSMGHPATLPCPQCGACGEVDQSTIPLTLLSTVTEIHKGTPMIICTCDLCDMEEDPCPVHPKGESK
jgi:hypothetical protein